MSIGVTSRGKNNIRRSPTTAFGGAKILFALPPSRPPPFPKLHSERRGRFLKTHGKIMGPAFPVADYGKIQHEHSLATLHLTALENKCRKCHKATDAELNARGPPPFGRCSICPHQKETLAHGRQSKRTWLRGPHEMAALAERKTPGRGKTDPSTAEANLLDRTQNRETVWVEWDGSRVVQILTKFVQALQ